MGNIKSAAYLTEYAKAQLGLPYWYGTFGLTASAELYAAKKKQYPDYYRPWSDFPQQYGMRVHDCVGLIKGALWSETPAAKPKYDASQDVSADGMRAKCSEKGDISSMPDIAGILVFMGGHVGVYIGGGYVVEARGHEYGVVKTELKKRPWKWWGKCPWIDYGDKPQEVVPAAAGKDDIPVKKVRLRAGTWNIRGLPSADSPAVAVVKGGGDIEVSEGWLFVPSLRGFISEKALG